MSAAQRGSLTPFGRRVRASLVLGGRTAADVSPELNISPRTFERMLYGKREARDWEIRRLADLCAVPEWFLRHGFDAAEGAEIEAEDLDGQRHDELIARLDELAEAVRALNVREGDPSRLG